MQDQDFLALVADLQTVGPGDTLRNALRNALGDPQLEIVYSRIGSGGGWIDNLGQVATEPLADEGRAVTPVERGGKPFAALIHDPALLRRPALLQAAVDAAALAFANEQHKADLRSEIDELRASRTRIVEAVDLERRRAERDLHDGAQQRLVGLALLLGMARRSFSEQDPTALLLEEASGELEAAITELRQLARGLHPAVLATAGLAAALESLAERPGVPVELHVDVPTDLPEVIAAAAYFVVAEALANVQKHADASHVVVRTTVVHETLEVTVGDDGRGGASAAVGSGLEGLVDRLLALGGRLNVVSEEGHGTTVAAVLPLVLHSPPSRDADSRDALHWMGWENFEIPAEAYEQLRHEDQLSWARGMFACAGGVSRITEAERRYAVGWQAASGAAPWVLETLRGYDVDESLEATMALPGMAEGGRGLLYTAVRMCTVDGPLSPAEIEQLERSCDTLGYPRELLAELCSMVDAELALRHRRYETVTAPVLPH